MSDTLILTQARVATLIDSESPYGLLEDGAIVIEQGQIQWVGTAQEIPDRFSSLPQTDLANRLVTPGLIDAHTHLVFAGNRADEFSMRLNGASYEEIARAGAGILSTVMATRAATENELLAATRPRINALINEGVCTVEIKSGYGLDTDTELKMLRVARKIAELHPIRVRTSFLGAHAIPPEYSQDADRYIDDVCIPTLRQAHAEGLVDNLDGFCEIIAFSPNQIKRVFDVAKSLDLPIKLHAEQLSNLGGTELASSYGALSCDHLEYLDLSGAEAMAKAGSTAVLLPGAFYTLAETRKPPVDLLREQGVSIAVATDCNPGSSPLTSLLLAMNMACTLFQLTPAEALAGITRNAAKALGLVNTGTIAKGQVADLAVWDVSDPAELSYRIGFNPLYRRYFGGQA